MAVCLSPIPIVFDLDGTLIDSAPDIHAAVAAVLRQNEMPQVSLDHVRGFIGGGVDQLWKNILTHLNVDVIDRRQFIASFMTRYHTATSLTKMYPNSLDTLGVLADMRYPMGICTNKPLKATQAILEHFGILNLFSSIIAGDSMPERKPAPKPLLAALTALGSAPGNPAGLFVGDSEYDAQCAAAAQVPLMLFTGGYRHLPVGQIAHHAKFDDFAELPALVERYGAAST